MVGEKKKLVNHWTGKIKLLGIDEQKTIQHNFLEGISQHTVTFFKVYVQIFWIDKDIHFQEVLVKYLLRKYH